MGSELGPRVCLSGSGCQTKGLEPHLEHRRVCVCLDISWQATPCSHSKSLELLSLGVGAQRLLGQDVGATERKRERLGGTGNAYVYLNLGEELDFIVEIDFLREMMVISLILCCLRERKILCIHACSPN